MPDYVIDPAATEHYETIGVIQGMRHLRATFTAGKRLGPGLAETLEVLQRASLMSASTTFAPRSANSRAVARPMPRAPPLPVMTATLPLIGCLPGVG
jgi:hypothetical protein